MNAYINELSDMVPSCNNLIRRPDKLTILKMAVSYMKSLRGNRYISLKRNSGILSYDANCLRKFMFHAECFDYLTNFDYLHQIKENVLAFFIVSFTINIYKGTDTIVLEVLQILVKKEVIW